MASSADRAAQLRAEADALEALAGLEDDLKAAKAAYDQNPSVENAAAKQDIAERLRAARAATRPEGVSVGGDAFVDGSGEG
jgi:hypothetical protein